MHFVRVWVRPYGQTVLHVCILLQNYLLYYYCRYISCLPSTFVFPLSQRDEKVRGSRAGFTVQHRAMMMMMVCNMLSVMNR